MNIHEFAACLAARGVGSNPGYLRHRLQWLADHGKPCPYAQRHPGRAGWQFEPAAVDWWIAQMTRKRAPRAK